MTGHVECGDDVVVGYDCQALTTQDRTKSVGSNCHTRRYRRIAFSIFSRSATAIVPAIRRIRDGSTPRMSEVSAIEASVKPLPRDGLMTGYRSPATCVRVRGTTQNIGYRVLTVGSLTITAGRPAPCSCPTGGMPTGSGMSMTTVPRWTFSATHLPRCTKPTPSTHSTSSKSDSLRAPFQSSWGNDVSQPLKPGSTCRPSESEPFASASRALGWTGATDGGVTAQAWLHPARLPSIVRNSRGIAEKAGLK
jgi:hypothetical protein